MSDLLLLLLLLLLQVFEEVSPLVRSCADGYNVCIFAYGQTGSGKTFTMDGPADNPGINTRALQVHCVNLQFWLPLFLDMLSITADRAKSCLEGENSTSLLQVTRAKPGPVKCKFSDYWCTWLTAETISALFFAGSDLHCGRGQPLLVLLKVAVPDMCFTTAVTTVTTYVTSALFFAGAVLHCC
jgi:hypothetical protein